MLYWRKFDANEHAVRQSEGPKMVSLKGKNMLFNLTNDLSEAHAEIPPNSVSSKTIEAKYTSWENSMMDPVFLGLGEDKAYNTMHPDRFERKKN